MAPLSPQKAATPPPSYPDEMSDHSDKTKAKYSPQLDPEKGDEFEPVGGVFGGKDGHSFRTVGRWGCLFALLTNQFGLGILSLPSCLNTLGLIPGLIAIIGTGALSWYTAGHMHKFYCKYPQIATVVDCTRIIGGRPFAIFTAVFFQIQLLMTCASAVVTLSIAFNTLSNHGMCTVGFIGVASIACWLLCVPRTIKFVAQAGVPTFISIIAAALTVIISLGITKPPAAPLGWTPDYQIVGHPDFKSACISIFQILYSFAGHHAFISYMAEMRDPKKDFMFSASGLFLISTILYSIIAIAIYCLAGSYTTSPALGSATILGAKVAYGLVLPAILTTGLSAGHVGIKYFYLVIMGALKASHEITDNTVRSWSVWMGCASVFWIICFVISNAIPVFDSIVSISSSTTFAWFGFGFPAIFWLYLNKGRYFEERKQVVHFCINMSIICLALFMNSAGLWASVTKLLEVFANGAGVRGPFDCGDNSAI